MEKRQVKKRNHREHFYGESRFIPSGEVLKKLHENNPYLYPISLAILEADSELFWHQAIITSGYVNLLRSMKGVLKNNYSAMKDREIGAFLHDIGKFGIIDGSIETSLKIVDYTPNNDAVTNFQKDQRPREIIARSHTHTLVGQKMIQQMYLDNIIPKEVDVNKISGVVFNHHRSDGTYRTSYPGFESLNGKDPVQVASEFLIEMMDFTIAMLTDRRYRSVLSFDIMTEELDKYLKNDTILNFILPVFAARDAFELRDLLRNQVLITLEKIQPEINFIPNIKDTLSLKIEDDERIGLQGLINRTWNTHRDRFNNLYQLEMANGFHADGRSN